MGRETQGDTKRTAWEQSICAQKNSIKKNFFLQESLWSQMLIYVILSDTLRNFLAILLLQVQTAAFLFTLCLILTLFRAGKSLRERKKNTFNYIIGHTLVKKHCPYFLTWATGMSSSKRMLQISRCQKDLFWNKLLKSRTSNVLNPALLDSSWTQT